MEAPPCRVGPGHGHRRVPAAGHDRPGSREALDPLSLKVPGTAASNGEALVAEPFRRLDARSPSCSRPGRRRSNARGRPWSRRCATTRARRSISPWDRGTVAALRPGRRKALIIVDYHVPLADGDAGHGPRPRTDARGPRPPAAARDPVGLRLRLPGLQEETIDATERAELLAVPLLLIVLLLVFRSVVAAAIPLAFGALTVLAGRGVLVLLSSVMTIDAISLVVCTMMGLALGVDYSLLIVSRFREELARRTATPTRPPPRTRATAGRTTLFAGATLLAALALSAFVQPGSLLLSLATTVGGRDRAQRPRRRRRPARPARPARRRGSTPARSARGRQAGPRSRVAAIAAGGAAPPRPRRGPDRDPAGPARRPGARPHHRAPPGSTSCRPRTRRARTPKRSTSAVGPGWEAPFVLVAAAEHGPITTPERLALLSRWQRRIAAQPGVRAVIGPGPVAQGTKPLRKLGKTLDRRRAPSGPRRPRPARPRPAPRRPRRRRSCAAASPKGAAGSALLAEGAERAAGRRRPARRRPRTGRGRRRSRRAAAIARLARRLEAARPRPARRPRSAASPSQLGLRSLVPQIRGGEPRARSRELATELAEAAAEDPSLQPQAPTRPGRWPGRSPPPATKSSGCATSPSAVNGGLNRLVRRRQAARSRASGSSRTPPTG